MDLSLGKLLLAMPLIAGGHEIGHQEAANHLQVPLEWDLPMWTTKEKDPKKLSVLGGAGFRGQQGIVKALGTSEANLVSGLHKLSYLIKNRGDLDLMPKEAKYSLGASLLADLYKASNPDKKWNLDFWQSKEGTPGLKYTTQWE